MEVSSLRTSSHGTQQSYASCQGRKAVNRFIQLKSSTTRMIRMALVTRGKPAELPKSSQQGRIHALYYSSATSLNQYSSLCILITVLPPLVRVSFTSQQKRIPFEADIDHYRKPHLVHKQREIVMECLVPVDTSAIQPPKLLSQKRGWEDW